METMAKDGIQAHLTAHKNNAENPSPRCILFCVWSRYALHPSDLIKRSRELTSGISGYNSQYGCSPQSSGA